MKFPARLNIPVSMQGRRTALVGIVALFTLVASACAVQESNAYPVEIFSEMHYSQAPRAQEPPRLQPPAEAVVYEPLGDPETSLAVPEFKRRAYDPAVAGELFRVNCSVCHGINGMGNGPAAIHLTSNQSFYASTTGAPYTPPANLFEARSQRTPEVWFNTINNGIVVMPSFDKLLSEEDIWDIIAYLFDEETGLGTAQ